MRTLTIDIESYSPEPLASSGVYRYAEHSDFDILLFAYSVDDGPVNVVDLAQGQTLPKKIVEALLDITVEKWAFNAAFERVCISHWLRRQGHLGSGELLPPLGWFCSMVWASALGLPRSLRDVGDALKLEQTKMREGNALIKLFCTPAPQPKRQAGGLFDVEAKVRNLPADYPDKWQTFIEYNRRDVEVESAIRDKLAPFPLPRFVWEQYWDDQYINDGGIRVDTQLAAAAIEMDTAHRQHCLDESKELTGLENPNSPSQLLGWLREHGCPLPSLAKADVADTLERSTGTVRRVLQLRQELSKSSVKKYQTMLTAVCSDGRVRGLLQFYGAGRTGRWAGRLVQVQNLPRNDLARIDDARELVKRGQTDMVELLYGGVPDTLSQLIRTAFIPSPGNRFVVADYSAIEARVLAWLAGEAATLQAFRNGEDLYCVTASSMFGVPVEKHGANSELRQLGKVSTLACGYGGGLGAIKAMGGEKMGMGEADMQDVVAKWRSANPAVVKFWKDLDTAATTAIATGAPQKVRAIRFHTQNGILFITLPSGRALAYPSAAIGTNRFGGESIEFYGAGLGGRFVRQETYGGKLAENITQAVARDLLAHAISLIARKGHRITMSIHDEVVIDAPPGTTVDDICDLMATAPSWADGLPLAADGYECTSYRKD